MNGGNFLPSHFLSIFKSISGNSLRIRFSNDLHAFYDTIDTLKLIQNPKKYKYRHKYLTLTSCSNIAYSPSVFWRIITVSISFWRAGTLGNDLQWRILINKSNSFLMATFLDSTPALSLFVSIFPKIESNVVTVWPKWAVEKDYP